MLDNHANYVSSFLFNCSERFIENCSFRNKLTSSTSCVLLTFYVLLSTFSYVFYQELLEIHILNIFCILCMVKSPMLFQAFLLYTFVKVDCPYVFCSIVYSIHSLPLAAVSIQWGEITAMLQHHGPGFRWIICPWSLTGCKLPGNNKNIFLLSSWNTAIQQVEC